MSVIFARIAEKSSMVFGAKQTEGTAYETEKKCDPMDPHSGLDWESSSSNRICP